VISKAEASQCKQSAKYRSAPLYITALARRLRFAGIGLRADTELFAA
jgi:hypothetical protein